MGGREGRCEWAHATRAALPLAPKTRSISLQTHGRSPAWWGPASCRSGLVAQSPLAQLLPMPEPRFLQLGRCAGRSRSCL